MIRIATIVAFGAALVAAPALSQTVACSTAQGFRTCLGPHGYVSREFNSQGMTFGSDSDSRKWQSWRNQGRDFLTVTPPPDDR